tara:strand:- start:13 stop:606 length:594 start_codon:yes stop_codon:yes gene_type:complete
MNEELNQTYPQKEDMDNFQMIINNHYDRTIAELTAKFEGWNMDNRLLNYNAKFEVSKRCNSDYYSLKTLETKLNSAKNALDRLSEENGSNIHGAHLMEVSQSRYENALRLRNGFEFSKSLVETSYNANAKYYKDTFEEEFVPRSVQADRKAIAGHQGKVKIWKKQITSNFSLKAAKAAGNKIRDSYGNLPEATAIEV